MPLGSLFAPRLRPLPQPDCPEDLRVTAVIALRDDAAYGDVYFANMARHGVQAIVIENDALPETRAIIDRWSDRGVVRKVLSHPFEGVMDWSGLLRRKQEVVNSADSDWFILWDSDECREPPPGHATLREALFAAGQAGYDTVGFDEFVFVPSETSEDYSGRDYFAEMSRYYYFSPRKHQRLNAFRKLDGPLDLMGGAGHAVRFRGQKIWPVTCPMRHYLFLSEAHGRAKYGRRRISQEDRNKGWMVERERTTEQSFRLPDPALLTEKSGDWDRSRPQSRHPCFDYTA